jgi:hypothetical protein
MAWFGQFLALGRDEHRSEWSKAHAIEVLLREGRTEDALRIPAPQIPHWDSYKMLLACARHESAETIRSLAWFSMCPLWSS